MIKRFDQFLDDFSKWGILLCLSLMLGFSLFSIILRWFGLSFYWIDPAVRHLVFVATFLGGSLATGRGQNIKIDLLARFLEVKNGPRLKNFFEQVVTLITMIIVLILAKSSWDFVKVELEFGKTVFWGIHSGVLVGIIPLGLMLISLRLVCRLCLNIGPSQDSNLVEQKTHEV